MIKGAETIKVEGFLTPEGAVRADELERLSFTPAGLVHWLVVDAVSAVAAQNGQRDEAEWLHELPTPAKRTSPAGIMGVLARVKDQTTATWLRTWSETNKIPRVETSVVLPQPIWFNHGVEKAEQVGLWAGATREARCIVQTALETASLRDRQDELAEIQVADDMGWRAAFLKGVEFHLWSHAREVTFLPFPFARTGGGLLYGGQPRWWPKGEPQQEVVELRYS